MARALGFSELGEKKERAQEEGGVRGGRETAAAGAFLSSPGDLGGGIHLIVGSTDRAQPRSCLPFQRRRQRKFCKNPLSFGVFPIKLKTAQVFARFGDSNLF
jgi:hypothetical protein